MWELRCTMIEWWRVIIVIWDVVWEEVSCYFPLAGRSVNEKDEFNGNGWKCEKLVGGDFNGPGGSDICGVLERFMGALRLGK